MAERSCSRPVGPRRGFTFFLIHGLSAVDGRGRPIGGATRDADLRLLRRRDTGTGCGVNAARSSRQ